MLIKPFDLNSPEIPDELSEILTDAGLISPKPEIKKGKDNLISAREALNASGASLDNIASTIGNVLSRGETEAARLKAAELAYKVHGILQEIDETKVPEIHINVTNQYTQENKTLINLVLPIT